MEFKNPISQLQEFMMKKKKVLPDYQVIDQCSGTHLNSFTIRVKCGELTEQATASNKQKAKTDAALKMLNLLGLIQTLPIQTEKRLMTHDSHSSKELFTNYIGKLQELCVNEATKPSYDLSSVEGPSHNPKFEISCKFGKFITKGLATKKKDAQQIAAKLMYEKLSPEILSSIVKVNPESMDDVTKNLSQLLLSDNSSDNSDSAIEYAHNQFINIKNLHKDTSMVTEEVCIKNYHQSLKRNYDEETRSIVLNKLKSNLRLMNSSSSNTEFVLKNLVDSLKYLNINLRVGNASLKPCVNDETYIHCLKLDTTPMIVEIAYATSECEAKTQAIIQITQTLIILLE